MSSLVFTYQTLTTAIINYLERNDANLIAQIPTFIGLAQNRIARELKILGLKTAVTGVFTPGLGTFPKTAGWLNDSSFNIGTGPSFNTRLYLLQRSIEFCRQYWPDPTQTGTPKYYSTDYDYNNYSVFPTPDIAYPYEVLFYQFPTPLDPINNTNFLTQNAPEVLLFASLLESAPYLKDDERVNMWQQRYDLAKQDLTDENITRIQDAFSKRGG